jgi:hypothetical protein
MPSSNSPILVVPESLPIGKTLGTLLRLLRREFVPLLQLILVLALVLALLGTGIKITLGTGDEAATVMRIHPHQFLYVLASMPLQAWMAVGILRYLVLGEKQAGWTPVYQPRMWRYLLRQLFVFLAVGAVAACLVAISLFLPKDFQVFGFLSAMAAASVLATRLSLVPVAAALGANSGLRHNWHLTTGQSLRLMTIKFLASLLMLFPLLLVVVLAVIAGSLSANLGMVLSYGAVSVIQMSVLQSLDALLFGHFYGAAAEDSPHG